MAGYVAASPGVEASSGEKTGKEAGGLALCRPWVANGLQLCRVSILFWSASVPLLARVGRWGGGEAVFGSPEPHSQSPGCIMLARRPSLIDLSRQACRRARGTGRSTGG